MTAPNERDRARFRAMVDTAWVDAAKKQAIELVHRMADANTPDEQVRWINAIVSSLTEAARLYSYLDNACVAIQKSATEDFTREWVQEVRDFSRTRLLKDGWRVRDDEDPPAIDGCGIVRIDP